LKNVQEHQQRLEIVHPANDFDTLPVWRLLNETVNQNTKDKSPSPGLSGELLRAILMNTPYPATLLNGVVLRIRAEREVTRGRAAIVKAYYLKHPNKKQIPEEVLTVSLNPDSTNVPYTLGRMFSVLEAIQSSANPGINTTIKDKYFNSASTIPATVFPTLINLAQKHLRKLKGTNGGLAVFYEKQLAELSGSVGEAFPSRLSLPQQGAFQLGYYHQTAARYQKKEESDHV
jgi:CRISPR-associated protein Csd1